MRTPEAWIVRERDQRPFFQKGLESFTASRQSAVQRDWSPYIAAGVAVLAACAYSLVFLIIGWA